MSKDGIKTMHKRLVEHRQMVSFLLLLLLLIISVLFPHLRAFADDSITLSIDTSNIVLNLSATSSAGKFAESTPANISVSTTNPTGYILSLSSSTGSTDLTNNEDNTSIITSISNNLTSTDFSNPSNTQYNNNWGYKPSQYVTRDSDIAYTTHLNTGSNAVFKPLPGDSGEILAFTEQANPTNSPDHYAISMGARVNHDTPTGSYQSDSFVLMAVVNSHRFIMQDFTDAQCDGLAIGENALAYDQRDHKEYTISRLGDGLCWMTSDLQLGSTEEAMTLTSENTDITTDFVLPVVETRDNKTQWGTNNSTEGLNEAHAFQYSATKNLYNWYTATGGTTYDNNDASTSICPRGWKLPTNAQANSYLSVIGEHEGSDNIEALTAPPLSFSSGYYSSTTMLDYTNKLYWLASGWQNATSGVYYGYYFGLRYSSGVETIQTSYGYQKMMGLGIRCVHTSNQTAGFTINLNPNGGTTSVNTLSGTAGEIIANLPIPTRANYVFDGWYTKPENGELIANTNIANGTTTYYAVWRQPQTVTFTIDNHTDSVMVIDSRGGTVGTITTSGQTLGLGESLTYTLKPSHLTEYTTDAITITTGSGTIDGQHYTVGEGSATVSITSKEHCIGSIVMQTLDSTSIATLLPNRNDTATVCDKRDGHEYLIGKLEDDKYWMLENLTLAGGTALSANNTDVDSTFITNFTTSNNLTKKDDTIVLPASQTLTSGTTLDGGFETNNYSYVFNSDSKTCSSTSSCYSYYSWDAATLGSARTLATDAEDAPYSICPKGWRLPTTGGQTGGSWKRGDTYALGTAYGVNLENDYNENDSNFYDNAGPGKLPNFLFGGDYRSGGQFNYGGQYGYVWTATSSSSASYSYNMYYRKTYFCASGKRARSAGFSVRCLFAN